MADEMKKPETENEGGAEIYTLSDENGVESDFELIAATEMNGVQYFAMVPVDQPETKEDEFEQYVVLKQIKDENGEDALVTIDDDDEFDRVADKFDDMLSTEVDFDGEQ